MIFLYIRSFLITILSTFCSRTKHVIQFLSTALIRVVVVLLYLPQFGLDVPVMLLITDAPPPGGTVAPLAAVPPVPAPVAVGACCPLTWSSAVELRMQRFTLSLPIVSNASKPFTGRCKNLHCGLVQFIPTM